MDIKKVFHIVAWELIKPTSVWIRVGVIIRAPFVVHAVHQKTYDIYNL